MVTAAELTPNRARGRFVGFPRLDSIRNRIIAFAVVATLIPSGITLAISYAQNRRALEAKITQDLVSQSEQSARSTSVWLRERLYDLRVFAASIEVENSLTGGGQIAAETVQGAPPAPGRNRVREYLLSLDGRIADFSQLMVLNANGQVVGTTKSTAAPLALPDDWMSLLRTEGQFVGTPAWDEAARIGKLLVGVPVSRADGRVLGAFAADLNLAPIAGLMRSFSPDKASTIYLVSSTGGMIASSHGVTSQVLRTRMPDTELTRMSNSSHTSSRYVNFQGVDVIGAAEQVPQTDWFVVSEIPADAAFGQLRSFRNFSI